MKRLKDKTVAIPVILFLIISGLGSFLVVSIYDVKYMEGQDARATQSRYEERVELVFSILEECYGQADMLGQNVVDGIVRKVDYAYKGNKEGLKEDLDNLSRRSKLTDIINEEIRGVYFQGIKNDNNDPFVMTIDRIVGDLSTNCAMDSSDPNRTGRTFEEELSMHFNPKLGDKALTAIVNQSDQPIFWMFLPVDPSEPWYKDLKNLDSMSLTNLKKLFIKYKGDIKFLESLEFLVPNYIFEDADLLGAPYVDYRGYKQENKQLIVNVGFNLHDVITHNPKHVKALAKNDSVRKAEHDKAMDYIGFKTILIIVESILLLIAFVSTAKIVESNVLLEQERAKNK